MAADPVQRLGRVERYSVGQRSDGVVLRMRQGRNGLGVMVISLAVLFASWWLGPFGPHAAAGFGGRPGDPDWFYWLWVGFFAFTALASLLAIFDRKDWVITAAEITATESLGPWSRTRRAPAGARLGVRTEILAGEDVMFRYRLHFLGADRRAPAFYLEFQSARSIDRFLELVRQVLTIDVVEPTAE